MKRTIVHLLLAITAATALGGCATKRHSATFGNFKVVYGEMGPVAHRWEAVKAAVAGWEVVAETDDDEEECTVLFLHKPK